VVPDHHGRPALREGCHAPHDRNRVGPVADEVSQERPVLGSGRLRVRQARLEGLEVGVQVGEQGEPHGT